VTKITTIFILTYYLFGVLCLPCGDFSCLTDLPDMYRHCKATEDKDMTPFDFVTDHLLNIDCLFDRHENGDDQKPHIPVQFHHQQILNIVIVQKKSMAICKNDIADKKLPVYGESAYQSDYFSKIFRPPIA